MSKSTTQPSKPKTIVEATTKNAVWIEQIKKEAQFSKLSEDFSVDPKNMYLYTEKPTYIKPIDDNILTLEETSRDLAVDTSLKNKIKRSLQDPRDKFEFPLSTQQDIGWFAGEKSNFSHFPPKTKSSCDETKYANAYYADLGVSPFAKGAGGKGVNDAPKKPSSPSK